MTPEEARLYLGISPYEDLDCDKIAECYRLKASMYSLDRFQLGSQEYIEARKMLTNIKEACDLLLSSLSSQQAKTKNDSQPINITLVAAVAVIVIMFLCLILGSSSQKENASSQVSIPANIASNYQSDYSSLVARVMPSMILIQTDKGNGSGFFVRPNGDIITNNHVIENAEYITVTTQDEQNVSALVKDYDAQRDMALLKVNTSYALPYLRISSTFPKQGERIISIGNPKGFQGTVSDGIISAYRTDGNNNLWVQFTAPVSQGSSGGALLNLNGEVIGMTTLNFEGQNLNFAVPCSAMNEFLALAINKPARALTVKTNIQPKTGRTLDGIPGVKFVRKDDEYEMYLAEESIKYDRQTRTGSFVTFWLPSEKAKAKMLKDPHFVVQPGEELGVCMLLYNFNLKNNTYVHMSTVNFCTNGNVARNYEKPSDEIKWRTAKKGSRIASLMNEVKKRLRIR